MKNENSKTSIKKSIVPTLNPRHAWNWCHREVSLRHDHTHIYKLQKDQGHHSQQLHTGLLIEEMAKKLLLGYNEEKWQKVEEWGVSENEWGRENERIRMADLTEGYWMWEDVAGDRMVSGLCVMHSVLSQDLPDCLSLAVRMMRCSESTSAHLGS